MVTSTTFPEVRYKTYQQEDFSRRYMWPNTALPSVTTLINVATKASKNRFSVQSVGNHGAHYPRTLRDWGRRLEANVTMEMMAKRYPELGDPAVFETFMRKWRYLFAYAAAGYAKGHIMSHVLTFYKVRNGEFFLWTLKSNIYCRMECLHRVLNRWEIVVGFCWSGHSPPLIVYGHSHFPTTLFPLRFVSAPWLTRMYSKNVHDSLISNICTPSLSLSIFTSNFGL